MHSTNFSLLSCSGKKFEISWKTQGKLRENSGNLVSQKCGHPAYRKGSFKGRGAYESFIAKDPVYISKTGKSIVHLELLWKSV